MVHSFTVSEEHLSNNRHSKKLKTLEPLHIEKTKQFFFAVIRRTFLHLPKTKRSAKQKTKEHKS